MVMKKKLYKEGLDRYSPALGVGADTSARGVPLNETIGVGMA